MSNLVTLPGGIEWDNDKKFHENSVEAQGWLFQALVAIMTGMINGTAVAGVKMLAILNPHGEPTKMCFSTVEYENFMVYIDKPYRHKKWPKVLKEQYVIENSELIDIDQWYFEAGITFKIEAKQ